LKEQASLKRTLGLFDATSIGIGAIIGAGIFVVTGVSAGLAGPAVILSIVLAGIIALFTALSFAELSSAIPKEGGVYEFAHTIISPFAGFMVGWLWLFSNVVAGAAISIGLASYFIILLPILPLKAVAVGACALMIIINVLGIRESSVINDILVLIKISVLCVFIGLGIFHFNLQNFVPFMPNGWIGVLQGAAFIFFAYAGFARISTVAEEVKDPKRTVPLSILLSLGVCAVLYVLTSLAAVGLLDYRVLAVSGAPLSDAAKATGNLLAVVLISLGAVAATTSVLLTTIIGLSRVFFAMARQAEFPKFMSKIHPRFGTPYISILLMGVIMMTLTVSASLKEVVAVSSFAALCYYAVANLAALLFRRNRKYTNAFFKSPFYLVVPLLGMITCVMLLFFLTPQAWITGTLAIIIGGTYYFGKKLLTKR